MIISETGRGRRMSCDWSYLTRRSAASTWETVAAVPTVAKNATIAQRLEGLTKNMLGYFLDDQWPLLQELVKKAEMKGRRFPPRDLLQSFGSESEPDELDTDRTCQ